MWPATLKNGIKSGLKASVRLFDQIIARASLKLSRERNALMTFLFHGLFLNEEEIGLNLVHPQSKITVGHFRQFVEYYLQHGYTFIATEDILNGLDAYKNYILITFDDGYFSCAHALPLLREYNIPAVFFISTAHIKNNRCFWWDVLYRERMKAKVPIEEITLELEHLKLKTAEEIEKHLIGLFSQEAFTPIGDIDRPFTPEELKDFARQKYVFLGNHTKDHAILTNYNLRDIKAQIINGQNELHQLTGIVPMAISFPNGNYSYSILAIAKENGLKLGITVEEKKNYLPLGADNDFLCLRRFVLNGARDIITQCEVCRSDFVLRHKLKSVRKNKLLHKHPQA